MSGELAVYQGSWLTLHTSSLKIGKWALVTPEGESEVAQSCLTLCDPMGCSPPGSSVCGILHARILEWVAISFSRGSSQSRNQTLDCRQILYH